MRPIVLQVAALRLKFIGLIRKLRILAFNLGLFFLPEAPVSIVTGANSSHFASSLQLLRSIRHFDPVVPVYYFDLGLRHDELEILSRDFPSLQVIQFPFHDYPDFFDIKIDAGQYGWKPAAIRMALTLTGDDLLWMDAGNLLIAPLGKIKKILRRDGIFIMQTSNTVSEFTHLDTLDYFSAHAYGTRLQLSAAIVGFSRNSAFAVEALNRWEKLSQVREVIAPQGSSRVNHRQDQALLTLILFGTPELDRRIAQFLKWKLDNRGLGLLTHQDIEF
jgi:hypothetical protein